jgi:hypothetical protein
MKKLPAVVICLTLCVAARAGESVLSRSEHFEVLAEPGTAMPLSPDRILAEFERIHAFLSDYFGWQPPSPVRIHLIPKAVWPEPGATAFQNGDGVHFRAEEMATEQGNWVHEMTHVFFAGRFPRWFDEPAVRALTALVWDPALFPHPSGLPSPLTARAWAQGKQVWATTRRNRSLEPVIEALMVRRSDVFRRFFALCRQGADTGHLQFGDGRCLSRDELLGLLSEAAGEDVEPLLRRWTGFEPSL